MLASFVLIVSLETYRKKRRFNVTPEPAGARARSSKLRLKFVVQRHHASRLHYDFRLEMDGVLKSWAVPKGPSLDPSDKRLAMQVEDHPVSYFDFEGIIPEGNYGGGTVMVWDAGTWEPLSPVPVNGEYLPGTEKEAIAMLEKGDLKFRLKGKRLKGDFALVHIKARRPGSKGNELLLIKKKDDEVVAGFDIDAYETSILTDRTMPQIAGDEGSAEWKSSPPAARGSVKAAWLADAVARVDAKKKVRAAAVAEEPDKKPISSKDARGGALESAAKSKSKKKVSERSAQEIANPEIADEAPAASQKSEKSSNKTSASNALKAALGAIQRPMPTVIHP